MSNLKYHRDDDLQEFDRQTEQVRKEFADEEIKKNFSVYGQITAIVLGVSMILEGMFGVIRKGLFSSNYGLKDIPDLILLTLGAVFILFSFRNIIRRRNKK